MNFGTALEILKGGGKVQREGWNGKGMWLAYQKAYPQGIPINKNTAEATGLPEGTPAVLDDEDGRRGLRAVAR